VRLDPYHLALADYLNRTDNPMFRYRQNETHITMLRKRCIGFQQHTADADVVTHCVNPGNGVARSKLYLNGITYRETTVPTLRLKRWAGDVFGFSHTFVPSAEADLHVDRWLNIPTTALRGTVCENDRLGLFLGFREVTD